MKGLAAKSFVAALFLSTGIASSATSSSGDAVEWLGRMSEALRQENYEGIFTYIRGTTFETV